jgi:HNH endonuclease
MSDPTFNEQILGSEAVARFWERVQMASASQCWLWTGPLTQQGKHAYGVASLRGVADKAHRVAYRLKVGAIPEGMTVDHLCREKLCCNPAHMEIVTAAENTARMYRSPDRVYPLVCTAGHAREFGVRVCRKCNVERVARSQAKKPEYYREMKRRNKAAERERKRGIVAET